MTESTGQKKKFRYRPGKNLLYVFVGISLLSILSVSAQIFVPLTLTSLALGVIGFWLSAKTLQRKAGHLTVSRKHANVGGRDRKIQVTLELVNNDSKILRGTIRDDVPEGAQPDRAIKDFELAAGESSTIEYEIQFPVRGRYAFLSYWIELNDSWQMAGVQFEEKLESEIKILPEVFSSEEGLKQSQTATVQLLDKLKVARQNGVGTEFESLAEYREGDDYRRIDWVATARLDYPVTRRFQIERHRDVLILIDCGRLMGQQCGNGTKLDYAVDSGLMLARVALNGGDRCGMGLFDNEVRGFVPPLSNANSIRLLTECVYDANSDLMETNFNSMLATLQMRQKKRSLVIILSDILDESTSVRFRNSVAAIARQHLVLFVAVRTPLFRQIMENPSENVKGGFEKAVTIRLMHDRAQAIQAMSQSGVHVLDPEPTEITVPLIDYFIELRQQNSL